MANEIAAAEAFRQMALALPEKTKAELSLITDGGRGIPS